MIFVPNIEFISKIVEKYDVYILDQWGVMHDGSVGYSHAVNCINKLAQLKKKLIIQMSLIVGSKQLVLII